MVTITAPAKRVLICLLVALATTVVGVPSTSAHPEGVSDIPDLADQPSDPILVHRATEAQPDGWIVGLLSPVSFQTAQAGCPAYVIDKYSEDGKPAHMSPVMAGCATDRVSMMEHSVNDCGASYAMYCVEQVGRAGYIPRLSTFSLYGVLYTAGEPVLARDFYLERMILGTQTQFQPFFEGKTQTIGEIGSVRVPDTAKSKTAYRWGVTNPAGEKVYTTVPMVTRVLPTITSIKVSDRTLLRRQLFNTTIKTDVPIYGYVRLEYKFGNRWIQISRQLVDGQRSFTVPGRINRTSGNFKFRVKLDGMTMAGHPWYDPTVKTAGNLKILTSWFVE